MKRIIMILMMLSISGCVLIYPARIVMPLQTKVVDSRSGKPIENAKVLRIVCDVHDYRCSRGRVDKLETDSDGIVKASGDRKWGAYIPAPGGMPAPNHHIAVWKDGYYAFVFSQYGNIDDIKDRTDRQDIIDAIEEIPGERKESTVYDDPEKMFLGGEVKLYRIEADAS